MSYGIKVPGFNVQIPEKSHVPPETDRKKARGVAPRAVRARGTNGKEEE
jgi:hypothetical protein